MRVGENQMGMLAISLFHSSARPQSVKISKLEPWQPSCHREAQADGMMPKSKEAEPRDGEWETSGQAVPVMEYRVCSSMLVHPTALNDVVCHNEYDFISLLMAGF